VAGGRGRRFDLAVVVQDDRPGALGRRFHGGLAGDHVQDGQPVERWGRTDDLGLLQQLGIVPAMAS
jgi:hypothetical protein